VSSGYADFEFDLPDALLTHLIRVLDGLETAPLTAARLADIPDAQGVYQLFLDGELVYIGKTDAEAGLRKRLERHAFKIQHRRNLDPGQISFKAVRIFVFTAIDLETQLIKHYARGGTRWNNRGFGANDPGRRRDWTRVRQTNFDAVYPIDLDRDLGQDFSEAHAASDVVVLLKQLLPYTFRYELGSGRRPALTLMETQVVMPREAKTARSVIVALVKQLPPGWQATSFLHQIILYRERVDDYPDAIVLARS